MRLMETPSYGRPIGDLGVQGLVKLLQGFTPRILKFRGIKSLRISLALIYEGLHLIVMSLWGYLGVGTDIDEGMAVDVDVHVHVGMSRVGVGAVGA